MTRCFLACPLPPSAVTILARWLDQTDLRQRGRPVPPAQWHMTLAFIGTVPAAEMDSMRQQLSSMPALPASPIALEKVGVFTDVLWVGPNQVPLDWQEWQSALQAMLLQGGWIQSCRPWVPHVSLLRRLHHPPSLAQLTKPNLIWKVESALLYQSTLLASGPVYEPLMCFATGRASLLPP